MILVKIGRMGQRVREYALNDGTNLEQAIKLANVWPASDEIIKIGERAHYIDTLKNEKLVNGETILIIKKPAVPNTIKLSIGRVGTILKTIDIVNNTVAVGKVLRDNNIHVSDHEDIWLHRGLDTPLKIETGHMFFNNNDFIVVEEKKELTKIKKILEEFDCDGAYDTASPGGHDRYLEFAIKLEKALK